MNVLDILERLRALSVHIAADGGELVLSGPTERIAPALLAQLRARKAELLDLLGERGAEPAAITAQAGTAPGGDAPTSFAQQRLWFIDRLADQPLYNLTDA